MEYLPDTIFMSRFYLHESVHMLKVDFLDAKGEVIDLKNIEVDIKARKKKFAFIKNSSHTFAKTIEEENV
jgi:hypothetical protein